MEIILLGTGCPNVDPNRLGPSQLVVHPGATIPIDCGSGVTQRMVTAGFTGRELDAVSSPTSLSTPSLTCSN